MLEKETSGTPADCTQPPQSPGAVPGGPFSRGHPLDVLNPSGTSHQYTLQFLIAAIKKSRSHSMSTNTEKVQ